jgi:outer membrane protein assembly factor BamB
MFSCGLGFLRLLAGRSVRAIGFSTLLIGGVATVWAGPDWPEFRGPQGDGIARGSKPPVEWAEGKSVKWFQPVHGKAWSSPIVSGGKIWLTTATEKGTELFVVCLDAATGKVLLDQKLYDIDRPQFIHAFNSGASPSPVASGDRVWVTFGSPGTACLDASTAKVLWERRDLECNHYRGAGSSPILHNGRLYLNFDGSDRQYIVALDATTGRTVWKVDRSIDYRDLGADGKPESEGDWRKAFATCHVAEVGGVTQLLSQGAKAFYGYDPETGRELWRVEERTSHSAGTRPVVGSGMVFFPSGWSQGQVLAIRPGKSGEVLDVNGTNSVSGGLSMVWRSKRNVPKKPALVFQDGLLFGIDDNGVATCWDAATGDVLWNERIGGNYSASPVAADGRLYFCSEQGKTTVVAATREFRKLAENQLGDGFMASPAIVGNALILRSKSGVYRVE